MLFLLVVLFTFVSFSSNATIYYVSNSGNDSNSGTSTSLAWRTLAKVNSFSPKAGDQILFKRGDSWKGTLIPRTSGLSGSPIIYGAYGSGNNPILTGFTSVTAWTYKGGNIWESTNAVSSLTTCNMVVINGVNTPMGRTPNSGYYYFQSHSDNYHITSDNLTGTPNWTGAELAFNTRNWETKRCPIIAQSGSTLNFTQPESFTIGYDNLKFIIQNDLRTLDKENEWYYNSSTKKISIYSSSRPSEALVSTVDDLCSITNKNYITISNIEFIGSNSKSISLNPAGYITIENCTFNYSGADAIFGGYGGTSDRLTIENCVFNNSNNGAIGITHYFPNAIIRSNSISNSGIIYGANSIRVSGTNNAGILYGISAIGSGSIIDNNTIKNTGYVGIRFMGNNVTVQNNFVENYCRLNHDGGGIYTYNANEDKFSGTKVSNNIVINSSEELEPGHKITIDAGIFLDLNTTGVEVDYNTIEVPLGCGIVISNGHNIDIKHNNIYNCLVGIRMRYGTISNTSLSNNTIIAKTSEQYVYRLDPAEEIISVITSDYNIVDRPIDNKGIFDCIIRTPTISRPYLTLSEWKSYSGLDARSKSAPQDITNENDLQLEYNATNSSKTVSLSQPMIDMLGTKYSTRITLSPYSSAILMKDANPDPNPDPITDVGSGNKIGDTVVYNQTSKSLYRRALPVTASADGDLESISIYHNGGTGDLLLGVYSDNSGSPGSLLGVTPSTPVNGAEGWQTVSLSNTVPVNSGETVWLAWVFENEVVVRYTVDSPGRAQSAATWTGGMPSTFGSSSTGSTRYSIYSSYKIVSAPPATTDNIGDTDIYSQTSVSPYRRALPVTVGKDGNIESISIYHDGGSGNVLLGVYSDNSDSPGSLLGVTSSTPVNGAEGWQTVMLSNPISVNSGETVWLAWIFEDNVGVRYTIGNPGRAQSTATWSGGMPSTFGSSSLGNTRFSIYCSYEAASLPPTTTNNLGNTDIYSQTSVSSYQRAMPVTFGEDGEMQNISIYHNGGTGNVLLGVYSDNSGSPGTLLGVTPSTPVNGTEGWQTVSLSSPIAVNSGEKVWLAWVFENNIQVRYTIGTPGRAQSTTTWTGGMPVTFGSSTIGTTKYSIYCSYTTGSSTTLTTKDLGDTDVYSSVNAVPYRRALPVVFSEDGEIKSISIYHNGGTGNVLMGVYSDNSGSPGSLLGVTPITAVNGSEGWQTVLLTSTVSVNSGETIWLSWIFQNSVQVRYTVGTPGRAQSTATWSGGMPATFGSSSIVYTRFSIYCTYTTGGTKSAKIELPAMAKSESNDILESDELKVYPNPFRDKLYFEFMTEMDAYAVLEIYNLNGQSIARLLDQKIEGGVRNRIEYVPNEIIQGVYIYRLTLDDNVTIGKVIYNHQ